ncbi:MULTISPECIES: glycosyltransferase family 1 protein [unclassified Polaribacter]|jgi:glycosyltransferase involved in cell wall biosynthesis|uniref:glycosyltransferase family 4 protein n=1 Tax=unclassified Polaribacter TaxID=196858 RepID=UPI00052DB0C3|nr:MULTISPECIES: glycosyltransferase family 1 protein [unclassified Polaribacter]KGL59772.1 putative mannosyltransferase, GT4 family [Polaribacter sp. Hel1_33_49]PKV64269.1 glycosyltransferase involved in cell wall biosynthesis [Polaribacter sp. Hel1_33_96]
MKIGIEGQRIFRKKKHGMDMVALELIKNLQIIDQDNEYFIFVKPDEDTSVLKETSNFKIIELSGGPYPTWEQIALPKAAKKYGCDVLHCTSNTAPFFTDIPLITILHDIIYMESGYLKILKSSASTYQKFGNIYRKLVVPRVVKKSKKVITVSHFEKNRIGEFFGIKGNPKLDAIYNGVSEHFKPVSDKEELKRVKKKYNLPDNYFFFLGNTDPKKNTKGTLKAFSDFLKQTKSPHKLVMLDYDQTELNKLLIEINDVDLINHIVLTGYVINTDLPAIYSQCDVFLYPSLRESFGIPMLEAMSCNVPVITSNTSSMPEVSGDAAHIVNPFNPEEITQGLIEILNNDNYRTSLCNKGLDRSKQFSWHNMAKDYLRLYELIHSEHSKKK